MYDKLINSWNSQFFIQPSIHLLGTEKVNIKKFHSPSLNLGVGYLTVELWIILFVELKYTSYCS